MMHGELLNIIIITVLLVLSVISVSTNSLEVVTVRGPDNSEIESDVGLWRKCIKITQNGKVVPIPAKSLRDMFPFSKDFTCSDTDSSDVGNSLTTMKILSILGAVFLLFSLILLMAMPYNKTFIVLLLVSGIMNIVSSVLWATDKNIYPPAGTDLTNIKQHHGYSWYSGLVSGILSVLFSFMLYFNIIS
jgi:hypothetical protein